jgi:hypothetical protein
VISGAFLRSRSESGCLRHRSKEWESAVCISPTRTAKFVLFVGFHLGESALDYVPNRGETGLRENLFELSPQLPPWRSGDDRGVLRETMA